MSSKAQTVIIDITIMKKNTMNIEQRLIETIERCVPKNADKDELITVIKEYIAECNKEVYNANLLSIIDNQIKRLSTMQIELLSTNISSSDYNEISDMMGNLKGYLANCPSYRKADEETLPTSRVVFFELKGGKYIASNGAEISTELILQHEHAIFENDGYIILERK